MIFTKTALYKAYKKPIDLGKTMKDGNRIFGDNKTFIGFIGMVVFGVLMQVLWGQVCDVTVLGGRNALYHVFDNTIGFNAYVGLMMGLAYMVCELPNSFVKRRLAIQPGKTDKGMKGISFFIIDQIDSLIGVVFVLSLFTPVSGLEWMLYLGLGAGTHIGVNGLLYRLRIRRNL